jgi:4-hydroxy-tetrahydrodipicolinate synthase
MDLRGLNPAPITAFTRDGQVDWGQCQAGQMAGLDPGREEPGAAGPCREGTFLTQAEQVKLIEVVNEAIGGAVPIIAGITGEGTEVACEEAVRAKNAGAIGALVYPSHGWLRFGYQDGAPQDRYKAIYETSGLQCILFQYPDATKATYNLKTQLEIAAQPGVVATKNGVRNMKRWDTEIPCCATNSPICRS